MKFTKYYEIYTVLYEKNHWVDVFVINPANNKYTNFLLPYRDHLPNKKLSRRVIREKIRNLDWTWKNLDNVDFTTVFRGRKRIHYVVELL